MAVARRLAAILAADVAGYSRLMGADEEGTHAALTELRRAITDPKIAEDHGRIVKTTGDGMLVEFGSVVDAVRCAVAMQRAMAEGNAAFPADRRIEFRIGINLGDIILDDGDIFGDGVNIAARLEALAEPGGICLGGSAHEQVRDKLDLAFEDLGEQQVKNITRAVWVYRIRLGEAPTAGAAPAAALALPDKPSVAALRAGARLGRVLLSTAAYGRSERKSGGGPSEERRFRQAGPGSGRRRPGHPSECRRSAGPFRRGHRRHDGIGRPCAGAQPELRAGMARQRRPQELGGPTRHRD